MSRSSEYLAAIAKTQTVTLPESGIEFRVRKANAFWFAQHAQVLPVGTGADAHAAAADAVQEVEPSTIQKNLQLTRKLVQDHVLEPKIRDNPDYEADEIAFEDLLPEDARFLIDYLMGIKGEGGESLDLFPKHGVAADASANG
jgi:hypothetical protein